MRSFIVKNYRNMPAIVLFSIACVSSVHAQSQNMIEQRVEKLEDHVSTFEPTIVELSDNLNKSILEYTQGLEASLEGYSKRLQASLDDQLRNVKRNTVYLNPYSKAYQSLETNTGTFLVSVEKSEHIQDGMRLHLNIGNPNFADYQNFTLKLIWGAKWAGHAVLPYEEWRQTLQGTEFTFQGRIEKGKWNAVTVDLIPVTDGTPSYIECQMTVASVELDFN